MVVICIWCALFATSYSCFQTKVLAKLLTWWFVYSSTRTPLNLCHCTEYKFSAIQVRISEENKLNASTQQLITTKISGCALKQRSKTLITASAICNCKMRLRWCLVEHEQSSLECAAGLSRAFRSRIYLHVRRLIHPLDHSSKLLQIMFRKVLSQNLIESRMWLLHL